MAPKKRVLSLKPSAAPAQLPVELSDVDKAKLSIYVGYAELAHSQVVQYVASISKKYALEEHDAVMPDGTIIRKKEGAS